ncbi:MAG: radical SAM protein [Candidatus Eisenbacteria bacterium]
MRVSEVNVRTILSKTNIPGIDYCLNPYTGCAHACSYCYATFMKKFTGHQEHWGSFIDVKVNAVELLKKALRRDHRGEVMMSSVTDPYQPAEATYKLTRGCLDLLSRSRLKVSILTKSDLVTRDIDILKRMDGVDVGLTVATDDEAMKRLFEPASPTVASRMTALKSLNDAGIATYVFIGPILPMNPEKLADGLAPFTQRVLIDRMNYPWKVKSLYRAHKIEYALEESYFEDIEARLLERLAHHGLEARGVRS